MTGVTSVKVGPFIYDIKLDAARIRELEKENDMELFGFTTHNKLEIVINPDMADSMLRETVLHEILHAVIYATGLGDRFTEKQEEHLVRALSPALFQFILDNPTVVRYLGGVREQ